MKPRARRRRAAVLLSLALAAGGLAASEVRGRVAAVEERVGPLVPVVVAREDVAAGMRLGRKALARSLAVRQVPAGFVPADALADPAEASGLRLAVPLPRGGYLTAGALSAGDERRQPGPPLRPGERAVEVAVAGAVGEAAGAGPGSRVDVLVTTEGRSAGAGGTYVALEDVELLDLRPGSAAGAGEAATSAGEPDAVGAAEGSALATLRVTARQAVFLTAAQAFARELRLLARPPGDRRRVRATPVTAGEL